MLFSFFHLCTWHLRFGCSYFSYSPSPSLNQIGGGYLLASKCWHSELQPVAEGVFRLVTLSVFASVALIPPWHLWPQPHARPPLISGGSNCGGGEGFDDGSLRLCRLPATIIEQQSDRYIKKGLTRRAYTSFTVARNETWDKTTISSWLWHSFNIISINGLNLRYPSGAVVQYTGRNTLTLGMVVSGRYFLDLSGRYMERVVWEGGSRRQTTT